MKLQTITTEIKVTKLTSEELVAKRDELKAIVDEAKKLLDNVNDELLKRVQATKERMFMVGDRKVSIVVRPSYKEVTLQFARRHDAVKEVVDTAILGALYKRGDKIPGILFIEYPLVS